MGVDVQPMFWGPATVCPSGQGDGPEIHWALPAGVRIPSLSTSHNCDDTGGTSWHREFRGCMNRCGAAVHPNTTVQEHLLSEIPASCVLRGPRYFIGGQLNACMLTPAGYGCKRPADFSGPTTVCPSGQGDGPEIHWALPAGVRIPSLSTSHNCDDTGGTSWHRELKGVA